MKAKTVTLVTIIIVAFTIIYYAPNYAYIIDEEGHSPFVKVVQEVRETVVNITTEKIVETSLSQSPLPFDDDFFKFFFPQPKQQKRRRPVTGRGSGFIFKREKNIVYIMTNNHVVEGGEEGKINVKLADKKEYKAELVGRDPKTDLAVIKIEVERDEEVKIAKLGDSDEMLVGDWVIAIGNPFSENLSRTVTVGIISAKGRANLSFGRSSPIYQDYIQTDAAINMGNSGGPLVNIKGEVIGINSAISTTSGGNIGIGFAIPVNIAKTVSKELIEKGYVERAYLGVLPQSITSELQSKLDLPSTNGVLIAKVEKDTPADDAGLKKGDVIITFDGQQVTTVDKFRIMVAECKVGQKVKIEVIRDGKTKEFTAKLAKYPEDEEISKVKGKKTKEWLGISVANVKSEEAKKFDIKAEEGVVVTNIEPDSPAGDSELEEGDVILEIENQEVKDIDNYNKIMKEIKDKKVKNILLYVLRGESGYRYVSIKVEE